MKLLKVYLILAMCLGMMPSAQANQATPRIIVLQYHHVDHGTPASTSITPELFDQHIQYIQNNGYTVWPLDDAINAIRGNQPLPVKTVVITIDDAYRSVYEEVYPRLKKLSWPFTVFTNPDATDNGIKAYLTWDEMREMQGHGALFVNHSHSHTHLIRKLYGESDLDWEKRIRADINKAQQRLEQELGPVPKLFAYPYGEHNPRLRQIVTEMGYVGFGQQSGPVSRYSDFSMLPRFPMAAGFARMKVLPDKMHSRPFPVKSVEPQDSVLEGHDHQPQLRVELEEGSYQKNALACYISGQGTGEIRWQDTTFIVKPKTGLPAGRSRYNCTAPDLNGGGYYWYSHAWFKKKADGSWYAE